MTRRYTFIRPLWLRAALQQCASTWQDMVLSIAMLAVASAVVIPLVRFLFWGGQWDVVWHNVHLFSVGSYPVDQVWRVWLSALFVVLSVCGTVFLKKRRSRAGPYVIYWLIFGTIIWLTLHGIEGVAALPLVETRLWGGFLLTVVVTVGGILGSFPFSVLLAFGRRSDLPVIQWFCVSFIELVRGVPMVTLLFMGQIIIPLFLPPSIVLSNLSRVMIAVTIFAAAYMAEYIRGGLQAIPRGQQEAARALGLGPVHTNVLILLPQAIKAVIPALVGQCISLFKDTALVAIVGLLDLTGAARAAIGQPDFIGLEAETYFAIGLIYWVCSKAMSSYSQRIERRLGVGTRY